MGVEPTRDRLTAPTGFEVRPPHRGRFSSLLTAPGALRLEQVETARIEAARVATPDRDAVAIEKLKYLDRDLASNDLSVGLEPVAKGARDEPAVRRGLRVLDRLAKPVVAVVAMAARAGARDTAAGDRRPVPRAGRRMVGIVMDRTQVAFEHA